MLVLADMIDAKSIDGQLAEEQPVDEMQKESVHEGSV